MYVCLCECVCVRERVCVCACVCLCVCARVKTQLQLVVSRSTCPPMSPPPHAYSVVLGSAVINTHTKSKQQRYALHLKNINP